MGSHQSGAFGAFVLLILLAVAELALWAAMILAICMTVGAVRYWYKDRKAKRQQANIRSKRATYTSKYGYVPPEKR